MTFFQVFFYYWMRRCLPHTQKWTHTQYKQRWYNHIIHTTQRETIETKYIKRNITPTKQYMQRKISIHQCVMYKEAVHLHQKQHIHRNYTFTLYWNIVLKWRKMTYTEIWSSEIDNAFRPLVNRFRKKQHMSCRTNRYKETNIRPTDTNFWHNLKDCWDTSLAKVVMCCRNCQILATSILSNC